MTNSKKSFTKEQLKDFVNYMRDDESDDDDDDVTKKISKVEKKTFSKKELQDFIKNAKKMID